MNSYLFSRTAICAGNGKIIIIHLYQSSSKYILDVGYVCNISNEGILSNPVATDFYSSSITWGSSQREQIEVCYNNGHFRGFSFTGSGNIFDFTIDSNNLITCSQPVTQVSIGVSTGISWFNQIGDIVLISGGSNLFYYIALDIMSGTTSRLQTNGTPGILDQDRFVAVEYKTINNVYSAIYSLYKYNALANNVELLDTKTKVAENGHKIDYSCVNRLTNHAYCPLPTALSSPYKLEIFDIVSENRLVEVSDTNYVIPYTNGSYPIGVAKDAGTTNDIIDVYMPVASS